ncbi:Hypothetical_protein [Hexamita inflata]|uniref:Hypothetical_protein n=1 Tax=Hexamita inflata TaxID=28002 RepID=A0AA86QVX4_9EUKA|nr:Hypothetical protein HINF_LOCUS49447 [Hexamita inflata]
MQINILLNRNAEAHSVVAASTVRQIPRNSLVKTERRDISHGLYGGTGDMERGLDGPWMYDLLCTPGPILRHKNFVDLSDYEFRWNTSTAINLTQTRSFCKYQYPPFQIISGLGIQNADSVWRYTVSFIQKWQLY